MWCCRQLLDLNPDNYRYHDGLREALGLAQSHPETWSDGQRQRLQELYTELAEKYPRSNSPHRIPLEFLVTISAFSSMICIKSNHIGHQSLQGGLGCIARPFLPSSLLPFPAGVLIALVCGPGRGSLRGCVGCVRAQVPAEGRPFLVLGPEGPLQVTALTSCHNSYVNPHISYKTCNRGCFPPSTGRSRSKAVSVSAVPHLTHRHTCRTPKKAEAIGRVFERLLAALQEDPVVLPALMAGGEEPLEPAGEALLWARVFLTRHYDKLGATGQLLYQRQAYMTSVSHLLGLSNKSCPYTSVETCDELSCTCLLSERPLLRSRMKHHVL